MKTLDAIAEEAGKQYWETGSLLTSKEIIRAAIDKALEVVLRMEPSDAVLGAGVEAFYMEGAGFSDFARAMQAALLEELKGNSSVARSERSATNNGKG